MFIYNYMVYERLTPEERRAKNQKRRWERVHPGVVWPGYVESPETREKKVKNKIGENNHNYGKPGTMLGKHHTDKAKRNTGKALSGENNFWFGTRGPLEGKPNPMLGKHHTEEACKIIGILNRQSFLDKQWYGSVTYQDLKRYCILFNDDFKERCRAYWGYKSVLSDKTQSENDPIGGKNSEIIRPPCLLSEESLLWVGRGLTGVLCHDKSRYRRKTQHGKAQYRWRSQQICSSNPL
jgi:hypothetical protein